MTAKDKAEKLVDIYKVILIMSDTEAGHEILCSTIAKQCALIAANEIILSNPHSNPFNTEVYSTMDYWEEVKQEIEKL